MKRARRRALSPYGFRLRLRRPTCAQCAPPGPRLAGMLEELAGMLEEPTGPVAAGFEAWLPTGEPPGSILFGIKRVDRGREP